MDNKNQNGDGTIIQFLSGSHSYEGVWFGDKHPKREGKFWWRSILREYFKNEIIRSFELGIDNEFKYRSSGTKFYEENYLKPSE